MNQNKEYNDPSIIKAVKLLFQYKSFVMNMLILNFPFQRLPKLHHPFLMAIEFQFQF